MAMTKPASRGEASTSSGGGMDMTFMASATQVEVSTIAVTRSETCVHAPRGASVELDPQRGDASR